VLPIDAPPISRCAPGEEVQVPVYSSHFSRRKREEVTLQWRLSGIDSLGWLHDELQSGNAAIAFPHLRVDLAQHLTLRMPIRKMLCTLWVRAYVPDGTLVARNYVQFLVDAARPDRETIEGRRVFRLEPHQWHAGEWNRAATTREEAENLGACHGASRGFFEFRFPLGPDELWNAKRLTVLIEASAFREGAAQTDSFAQPTAFRLLLNGVPIYRTILPNHPHDARGALSYLHGRRGAYGYLTHATVEGALLEEVKAGMKGARLRLRCAVPRDQDPHGGLTIYGSASGRYPIGPTLIID
jgi:hypothetical protein